MSCCQKCNGHKIFYGAGFPARLPTFDHNLPGVQNYFYAITVAGAITLAPGASVSVPVQFNNGANKKVSFTSVTYSGQFH